MADVLKHNSGAFGHETVDEPERTPMSRAKGGDGAEPNRSSIVLALIIGLILLAIAIIVGGGSSILPGAR